MIMRLVLSLGSKSLFHPMQPMSVCELCHVLMPHVTLNKSVRPGTPIMPLRCSPNLKIVVDARVPPVKGVQDVDTSCLDTSARQLRPRG
jgi:hypothetical protein